MSLNGQIRKSVQQLESSMNVKNDRRSQRTRQALGSALMELMMEQGYESVSIKDIADRANVGRSTFYAHYADKDELFASQFDRMIEALIEHAPGDVSERNPFFPSLGLFQHVREMWKLYKILSWEPGMNLHAQSLQKSVSERIEQHILASGKNYRLPTAVIANYLAGSLLSMLRWWLDNKMNYSPEQMDDMFCSLALPGISHVAQDG